MTNGAGYKKPPVEGRWEKGKSGNPSGRPKGSRNFATAFQLELREIITLIENGKSKRISKQQAIAKALIAGAIKREKGPIDQVLRLIDKIEHHESAADDPTQHDDVVMSNFLRYLKGETDGSLG